MKSNDRCGFKLKFDGESYQIDAHTYLHSLFSITGVIEEINEVLKREYNIDKNINIKIDSHESGSFVVNLFLSIQIQDFIKQILKADNVVYCAALVTILSGLYKFRKELKGAKIKDTKEQEKKVEITTESGNTIIVDKATFKFARHDCLLYGESPERGLAMPTVS